MFARPTQASTRSAIWAGASTSLPGRIPAELMMRKRTSPAYAAKSLSKGYRTREYSVLRRRVWDSGWRRYGARISQTRVSKSSSLKRVGLAIAEANFWV